MFLKNKKVEQTETLVTTTTTKADLDDLEITFTETKKFWTETNTTYGITLESEGPGNEKRYHQLGLVTHEDLEIIKKKGLLNHSDKIETERTQIIKVLENGSEDTLPIVYNLTDYCFYLPTTKTWHLTVPIDHSNGDMHDMNYNLDDVLYHLEKIEDPNLYVPALRKNEIAKHLQLFKRKHQVEFYYCWTLEKQPREQIQWWEIAEKIKNHLGLEQFKKR